MPTPDRTSIEAIVDAASVLLEQDGLALLTMNAVAHRVGVRAPSLYKRVESRDRLIQLIAESALSDLATRLPVGVSVAELANGMRAFGHARPAAFQLVMAPGAGTPVAGPGYGATASMAILHAARQLAGDDNALPAARTLTAWATGFISMELNGGFNLGGDVDEAWRFGIASIVEAITAQ